MRTTISIVKGNKAAEVAANRLVIGSRWFQFTPLPEDEYEFATKSGEGGEKLIEMPMTTDKLLQAALQLLDSGSEEGCDGLVVVDKGKFEELNRIANHICHKL